jgi:hypothetical protein
MSGAPDPLYVKAREILLDALEALGPHRSSLVLVGAQAIRPRAGINELMGLPPSPAVFLAGRAGSASLTTVPTTS